ncbi:hypothetical protein BGZ79_005675 [Entomortierella chlamydospora]|nr:hypothetical protein BGZ79_005675 [Entomortierella chlamydospora]
MYEDPISQLPPHYGSHHQHISHDSQQQLYMHGQRHRLDQEGSDQELHRLHQHQTLIQLRLEVNALRTQIQQLELLKQQLIHQKQFMQPEEYDQLMDQFSRTTASLLRVANPSHFSNGRCNERSIERISSGGGGEGGGEGNGGSRGGEPYVGMQMMERLQEKLRNMTIQQHEHQQQQSARRQQELQHQRQQSQDMDASMDTEPSGAMSPRRDPVRMEQMSLEADLRDLEQRMRSIQLLR